ncbi:MULTISPECIES: hypothetical protein [unclassified Modestobacter]
MNHGTCPATRRTRTPGRAAGVLLATALGLGGLAACGDSAELEPGVVTTDELRQVQEDVSALEDRVRGLEDRVRALAEGSSQSAAPSEPPAEDDPLVEDDAGVLQDAGSLVGQDVTVSARVVEVLTATDLGSAFRIGTGPGGADPGGADPGGADPSGADPSGVDQGGAVPVLTASPFDDLDVGDVVRVSGTVTTVDRDTFEQDFGIAAEVLLDDPDGFFADHEGEAAVAADRIAVVAEQAGS